MGIFFGIFFGGGGISRRRWILLLSRKVVEVLTNGWQTLPTSERAAGLVGGYPQK
jgi:hypothetical protein